MIPGRRRDDPRCARRASTTATGKRVETARASGSVRWTNCDPTASYQVPVGHPAQDAVWRALHHGRGRVPAGGRASGTPPDVKVKCQTSEVAVTAVKTGRPATSPPARSRVVPAPLQPDRDQRHQPGRHLRRQAGGVPAGGPEGRRRGACRPPGPAGVAARVVERENPSGRRRARPCSRRPRGWRTRRPTSTPRRSWAGRGDLRAPDGQHGARCSRWTPRRSRRSPASACSPRWARTSELVDGSVSIEVGDATVDRRRRHLPGLRDGEGGPAAGRGGAARPRCSGCDATGGTDARSLRRRLDRPVAGLGVQPCPRSTSGCSSRSNRRWTLAARRDRPSGPAGPPRTIASTGRHRPPDEGSSRGVRVPPDGAAPTAVPSRDDAAPARASTWAAPDRARDRRPRRGDRATAAYPRPRHRPGRRRASHRRRVRRGGRDGARRGAAARGVRRRGAHGGRGPGLGGRRWATLAAGRSRSGTSACRRTRPSAGWGPMPRSRAGGRAPIGRSGTLPCADRPRGRRDHPPGRARRAAGEPDERQRARDAVRAGPMPAGDGQR